MNRLLASLVFAISLPAVAQIYVYTDASGNPAYTNDPPEGVVAQPVGLPPTNSMGDTPDDSSAAQPVLAAPAVAPATGSAATSDQGRGGDVDNGDDAYDNQQDLREDIDPARAAAIDAARPGPVRVDTPTVDAVVPGPGKVEEGRRR